MDTGWADAAAGAGDDLAASLTLGLGPELLDWKRRGAERDNRVMRSCSSCLRNTARSIVDVVGDIGS